MLSHKAGEEANKWTKRECGKCENQGRKNKSTELITSDITEENVSQLKFKKSKLADWKNLAINDVFRYIMLYFK